MLEDLNRLKLRSTDARPQRTPARVTVLRTGFLALCTLARLTTLELPIVRLFAMTACSRPTRTFAITLSRSGNGWIYLILAGLCVCFAGSRAFPAIIVGAISISLLHGGVYSRIKQWSSRPRPYRSNSTLVVLLPALDEHSFPSGHTMTLTAVLIPIAVAFPKMLLPCAGLWILMAWARLASAHHYPSDVLGGATLGLIVSYPMAAYALSA